METKKKRETITKAGQLCWHCNTPVRKAIPKKKPRGNRLYYYTHYLRCPNAKCPAKAMYMPEEAKRFW